ncbi:MAG: hypothetical protein U9Q15_02905 [Patescibacteria group bacterium]|nr:hypothetical protein [Patescibacteria group bacterium]
MNTTENNNTHSEPSPLIVYCKDCKEIIETKLDTINEKYNDIQCPNNEKHSVLIMTKNAFENYKKRPNF